MQKSGTRSTSDSDAGLVIDTHHLSRYYGKGRATSISCRDILQVCTTSHIRKCAKSLPVWRGGTMVLAEQPHWPQPFLWPPVISVICCSTSGQYSTVQCAKHEALISSYQSNVFHPSVFLSLSLLRSALTAESQCDRFLSEVVKSYRQMATIKFVSVSTSPELSSSAAPHSHILLGHREHFIKMVSSYRHTGDPSTIS